MRCSDLTETILSIENLTVDSGETTILENISLNLFAGKITAIVGLSGSGKSTIIFALLNLLKSNLNMNYSSYQIDGKKMMVNGIHREKLAYIPQNPSAGFHPYIALGKQLTEYASVTGISTRKNDLLTVLGSAGIQDPELKWNLKPGYLSGGEKQRILIAIALLKKPLVFLADEPTTALDSINEKMLLTELYNTVKNNRIGMLLITHDTRIVKGIADNVYILEKGKIIEELSENFTDFQNEYTKWLFA